MPKNRVPFGVFCALLILSLLSMAAPARPASAAEVSAKYNMAIDLDYDAGVVTARETVAYQNTTGATLNSIVFNVTPAYYGAFTLLNTTVDGQAAQPSRDGVVLEVPLRSPAAPGASIGITLDFRLQIPTPGNLRFGRSNGIIALGNWYPVVSPYLAARGDWDRHQYTDVGDAFFTESADYDITLRVNRSVSLAYTGTATSVGPSQWLLSARGVRDFALALSDIYESKSATVDNVTVTSFFLPQHADGGSLSLRTATEVVRWADRVLSQYPYSSLFVAETPSVDPTWVGQEYPNIVLMGSQVTAGAGGMGSYLSYLVAHEVLHQWFYGLVGDDQLNEPWLDEATVVHLTYQFFRANYPSLYADMWQRFVDGEQAGIRAYGDAPVNTSIYDYTDENNYFIIVYRKGAVFMEELREALGDDAYFAFLRDVLARFSGRIVTGPQFLDLAQAKSNSNLSPLIQRYFTYAKYTNALDYDVPGGRFYTQANGQPLGASRQGFAVVDDAEAQMWTEMRRLGGPAGIGYPISRRFKWDGFVSQAMQKGVLQWRPSERRAYLVNVFDEMSKRNLDSWLSAFRQVPPAANWNGDTGLAWPEVVKSHQTLLDLNPAIKAQYLSVPDPINVYGLPESLADTGNNYTLRAQRVVIQQWKVDVPWAAAGQVTIANGGDIAKEAGLLPKDALMPEQAP